MSVHTIVIIKCKKFYLNREAFLKLDNCFAVEKLYPHEEMTVFPPLPPNWESNPERLTAYREKQKYNNISQRESALSGGGTMFLRYFSNDTFSAIIDVVLYFDLAQMCAEIRLTASTGPGKIYSKHTFYCARAFYKTSLCLHTTFDAIDTRAMLDLWEDNHEPWFHFSDSEWKTAEFILDETDLE